MAEVATPTADQNDAVIAALAAGQPVSSKPFSDQPMPPANGQAEGKDVQVAKETPPAAPPAVAEQPPATPATPATEDPFLKALTGEASAPPAWDDAAKNLFKQTYGEEDPIAYKEKVSQTFAKMALLEKEAEDGRTTMANIKKIEESNPALAAALMEELKGGNGLDYIASIPNPKILGKASKDLSDEVLLKTYMGDKFTAEQWDAYKNNDFSDLNISKDEFEAQMKFWRKPAEHLHDERNADHLKGLQAREQAIVQMRERDTQVTAEGIAIASNDQYAKLYLNQETIEAARNKSLYVGTFLDENGALHPQATTSAIKAKRYDVDVKRAYEAGLSKGKQSGLQEGTAQLPNARSGQRVVTSLEQAKTDQNDAAIAAAIKTT